MKLTKLCTLQALNTVLARVQTGKPFTYIELSLETGYSVNSVRNTVSAIRKFGGEFKKSGHEGRRAGLKYMGGFEAPDEAEDAKVEEKVDIRKDDFTGCGLFSEVFMRPHVIPDGVGQIYRGV